jgi:hypothetical protein
VREVKGLPADEVENRVISSVIYLLENSVWLPISQLVHAILRVNTLRPFWWSRLQAICYSIGEAPIFCVTRLPHTRLETGRVAERLKAPVLKTGVLERVSGVRIPPLPPVPLSLSALEAL